MRMIVTLILMVMMLALLAPMTAMACIACDSPVTVLTMDKGTFVVLDTAVFGIEQPRPHEGKTLVSDNHGVMIETTAIMSAVFGDKEITYMRPRATADKAGGAAIFASGKPMPSPFKAIVI